MKILRRGPLKGDCSISRRVQPTCEQSLGVGHAYTATLYHHAAGLRPRLRVGGALPFSSLPIDYGPGPVASLCIDAADTGLLKIDER